MMDSTTLSFNHVPKIRSNVFDLQFSSNLKGNVQWFAQKILIVVFIVMSVSTIVGTTIVSSHGNKNSREIEKEILDQILGNSKGYDNKIRPSGVNGTPATTVSVNLYVRSIATIDDVKMEYSVQLTFREQWMDERLRFFHLIPNTHKIPYLTLTDSQKVWMPDLFFSNEKKGHLHTIILPNVYIRIFPDGQVLYSIRISLTLSCPMVLKLYPLDSQVCSLRMASYGWTTADLIFQWKSEEPVQVTNDLHLPKFALEQFTTDYCDSHTNTGVYSCLRVDLLFKRQFSYYLLQIYIPCCMLVIVSWVSFWLDQSAVPARVSLGVTTLLTMATQTSSINQKLPPVSYMKALDVWTGVCLMFVFGALMEFALVNYASRSDQHREALKKRRRQWELEQGAALEAALVVASSNDPLKQPIRVEGGRKDPLSLALEKAKERQCEINLTGQRNVGCCKTWLSKFPSRSKRIDVISRIIFPLIFALFNLVYWSAYLTKQDIPS